MARLKWLLGVALLATTLVFVSCGADPTPTPPPPPTATPTPVPAEAPAEEMEKPTPTAMMEEPTPTAVPQEPVTVNLLATLSFMAEIVEPMRRILEEQSSFVSMTVEDTTGGPAQGWVIFNQIEEAERKWMIPWTLENDHHLAESGLSPRFPDGVMGPPMVLMKVGPLGCSGVGTLDPDIVTFADLDGKTLQGGTRPSLRHIDAGVALGIDVTHVEHGGDDVTVRELKNGQIDASYYHMTGHTRPVPQLLQLLQEQDGAFYFVDVKPAIEAIQEKFPGKWPYMFPVPLFAGELKETFNLDTDPIRGAVSHCFGGQNPYFAVSAEMDEHVAYEIVYQTVKNRADFGRFLSGDIDAIVETLGMTYRPQRDYHPGARKAFEDLGYPYGLEATIEYQRARAAEHGQDFEPPQFFLDLINQ